jgi:hypothetical protein
MNIFALHKDPETAARYHCDTHVVKMILESAQLLCTAHRVLDGDHVANALGMYKATHKNHPSAIWARQTDGNYRWLWKLLMELCHEYTHRYGKVHKVQRDGLADTLYTPPRLIPMGRRTEFSVAMPEEYRSADPVESYRRYYAGAKRSIAKWNKTRPSPWFMDSELYCE